ncbi:MAG TPA: hypothetical protein DCY79_20890 [Planctomycetaceae bacterium]|nr:hypothetical protein [Blastopirellula sp.]HAY82270.1 hypothetical protein [Planctomycetaceae bacterium]
MRTATLFLSMLVLSACLSPVLHGQSFLDQLEKQIGDGAPAPEPASPVTSADSTVANEPAKSGYLGLYADQAATDREGVKVTQLVVGGPANQAGIRAGDTITAIDGQPVKTLAAMGKALQGKPAGTRVRFEVLRNGKTTEHVVKLGEKQRPVQAPEEIPQALPVPEPPAVPPQVALPERIGNAPLPTPRRATLGVAVTDVTSTDVLRYGLRSRQGAMVRSVKASSPARRFGLTVGSLIIAANGRNISGADDLVTVVGGLTPDDTIDLSYYIGKQLYTKSIPLSAATVTTTPARRSTEDRPLRIVPPGEERPLLRGLERALNGIVSTPRDAAAIEDDNAELLREVEALREELRKTRARVVELEKQLAD